MTPNSISSRHSHAQSATRAPQMPFSSVLENEGVGGAIMTGSTLAFLKAHPVQSCFFSSFCFYLFIVGCAGSLLVHRFSLVLASRGYSLVGVRASHCSGFSCCRAWALCGQTSIAVVCGLSSCDSWSLEHKLTIVAHGLSCSAACGIFRDWALNLRLLHWQADSLSLTEPPRKPPAWSFEQERHFVTLGYSGCDMFHPPTSVLTTGPDTLKD